MLQICDADADGERVGPIQTARGRAAVMLHRADGADEHGGAGAQARGAALDVHKLLKAQVGAESGLRNHVVRVAQSEPVGDDGTAAVRDVAERARMSEHGLPLQRLNEIRNQRVAQQRHQRADRPDVAGGDALASRARRDRDPAKPGAQIGEIGR